ncbi:hypothetical protein M501DRAFT_1054166 [Patellaria atrata CBS 101060]|uniref:CSN8/PSMD8/EIF3K domain-containing protein n=1 Tax=Patellaria atrata CBS 101060 TaxID=1346257 RepID=A0A9P4VTQ5_9PEZI|nr:hypothetical protein M501DRAFT_1054166 [Patellaria atrata CBS 101060]
MNRPSARRGPSGAWGRLKSPAVDPLEVYELPSKGEKKLNDPKAQEAYYEKIVERYMKFSANTGGGDALDKEFAALSTNNGVTQDGKASEPSLELSKIIFAIRKLRESIVAVGRHDTFAQRAYIFIIRAGLLTKSWDSYNPALLYLLTTIHIQCPLSSPELHEFVGYFILDLACRKKELRQAYETKAKWDYSDRKIDKVLNALVHDDWVGFWRVKERVDGYQRRVMEWADNDIRLHALKCLGRSYFSVDKEFVERSAGGKTFKELKEMGVGWEGNGTTVTIRKVKAK